MREILFKGKRKDNGEWVEGFLFDDGLVDSKRWFIGSIEVIDAKYDVDNCLDIYGHCIYEVIPKTVCQYTGLKDMNGKKIFEGDIIKYADELDYRCYIESLENPEEYEGCDYSDIFITDEVVYDIEYGYPAFDLNNHDFECNALSELNNGDWHYEVIGTIFDNPELLEVGE